MLNQETIKSSNLRRLDRLEQWKNGNGSRGAEKRLQDVEGIAADNRRLIISGELCPVKKTVNDLSTEVKKLHRTTTILIILTGILVLQLAPEFFKFLLALV